MNDTYDKFTRTKFNEMFNKDIDYIITQIGKKIEDNILLNFAFMDDDEISKICGNLTTEFKYNGHYKS